MVRFSKKLAACVICSKSLDQVDRRTKTCSDECAIKRLKFIDKRGREKRKAEGRLWHQRKPDLNRKAAWRDQVKRHFELTLDEYNELTQNGCEVCGWKEIIHLHHKIPGINEKSNFQCLCPNHHLLLHKQEGRPSKKK